MSGGRGSGGGGGGGRGGRGGRGGGARGASRAERRRAERRAQKQSAAAAGAIGPEAAAGRGGGDGVASAHAAPTSAWWIAGAVCLGVSIVASAVLSLSHLGTPPPGCGPQSACAKVTSSVWGRLPVLEWPTAFLGLAWFAGLLAGWIAGRGRLPRWAWGLAALGGAGSVLLIGVMLADRTLCPWCLASHAGNLGFLGVALLGAGPAAGGAARRPGAVGRRRATLALASVAIAATVALAAADLDARRRQRAADEAALAAATESIIEAGRARSQGAAGGADGVTADGAPSPAAGATETGGDRAESGDRAAPASGEDGAADGAVADAAARGADAPDAADASDAAGVLDAAGAPDAAGGGPPFTGRWRLGPERAAIRVVAFLDYQCPDCATVEAEIARLVRARDDVSLSVKHFPLNTPCNRLAASLDFNPHPNACWAARAAEAAGILGGQDAFWSMSETLFARRGSFTDAELRGLAAAAGFEPPRFARTMTSDLTRRRVESDVEEGIALGVTSTPMLFVNGVELGGWRAPGALERTIERLADEGLPALSAAEAGDRPRTAAERFVEGWATSRRIAPAVRRRGAGLAPPAAFGAPPRGDDPATVVVFGDLGDERTRDVDARLRERARRDARVRYVFRHAPLERACHPGAATERDTGGCLAARIAIAAGRLGGAEAATTAHRVLVGRPAPIDAGAIAPVAAATGLAPADLAAALADPETEATLAADVADAASVPIGRRVVTVIVGGRIPARLDYDRIDLLARAIERTLAGD